MNKSGKYVKNLSGDAMYMSFCPASLPPQIEIDKEMYSLLISATKSLTTLNVLSARIPNISLFISMYVRKEALLSSQIEGTQATLEDILDPVIDVDVNQDVSDVINYIKATDYALNRLKELPLCNRLIKETHAVLMSGVRGQEKNPGEFRKSQNWIGASVSTIKNARYIPPNPVDMVEAMSDLEEYINSEDDLDVLIKAALIHYQFETIHPFLDGNGRIGRLLITLFLIDKKVLNYPSLYISYYLKINHIEYYDRMSEVRNKDNYEQWIKFFLRSINETCIDSIDTIYKLEELHNNNLNKIETLGRASITAKLLFEYIEKNPIIDVSKTAKDLNLAFSTISSSIKHLVNCGILTQINKTNRNRIFIYEKYVNILKKDTE